MKSINRLIVLVLVLASLLLSACGSKVIPVSGAEKVKPAQLEPIPGSDLQRVKLTAEAAERIGLQKGQVRVEDIVRKRIVGGIVVLPRVATNTSASSASINVWVRVPLIGSELGEVDQSQPVLVSPLADTGSTESLAAHVIDEDSGTLYYALDATRHSLTLGQRVQVELSLLGGGRREVLPYSAVLYGGHGETWVFVNPEPLVFVRQPIVIDYISDGMAVISEGPEVGTEVVTDGSEELYGSEIEFAEE